MTENEKRYYIKDHDIVEAELVATRKEGVVLYSDYHGMELLQPHDVYEHAGAARTVLLAQLRVRYAKLAARVAELAAQDALGTQPQ